MSDRTIIEAARALIEPLKGYVAKPWQVSGVRHTGDLKIGKQTRLHFVGPDGDPVSAVFYNMKTGVGYADAGLIAAAPTMRDTIAALADHAEALTAERDALTQRVETLSEALGFYAELATYDTASVQLPCECCSDLYVPVERDGGEIARAALQPEGTP